MSGPRVIVDARIVDGPSAEHTGLGRYTLEVVRGLAACRPSWELVVLSNRTDLFPSARQTRWPTGGSLGRITWQQSVSWAELRGTRADLWFGPSYVIPSWWRGASVVTVHDLAFLITPDQYRGRLKALHATWATRSAVARARRTIAVSEATRDDMVRRLDVSEDQIAVIHNGVSDVFRSEAAGEDDSAAGARPRILFVGTFGIRKGLDTLLELARLMPGMGLDFEIVLAGRLGWGAENEVEQLRRLGATIVEGPSDPELASLYRGAFALVHPSIGEGFGLPVAEAMAAGTAVLSSDLPAVREFAGEVPLYAPAGDAQAFARHLQALVDRPGEREARVAAGRAAAVELVWSRVAERHAEVLERALAA